MSIGKDASRGRFFGRLPVTAPAARRVGGRVLWHRIGLVVAGCVAATAAMAQPQWYQIDPVHTRVLFFVDHARFSRSVGMFRPVQGGLWFDRDDWRNSRVELCLPLSALDMGDRGWEQALRRTAWFDGSRHPELCFRSTRLELLTPPRGRLHGTVTVRGVERPMVLDFTINDERRFALTLKRRLGISAVATLSRADFGMDRDRGLVGDAVEVMIELEAQVANPPSAQEQPSGAQE